MGEKRIHWDDKFLEPIRIMLELGATQAQIAQVMPFSSRALDNWIKKKPEVAKLVKEAKERYDSGVRASLARRAKGMTVTDTKIVEQVNESGEMVVTKKETTTKELAPDSTSMIFWLKNRDPKNWRDKQDIGISGEGVEFNIHINGKDKAK